jgi:aminomethyltransferase
VKEDLKKTPLFADHERLQGKIVPFAGYAMPVQYRNGIRAEHQAVRESAGLFDVSHMGEFRITGPDAVAFVSYVTTNDPQALGVGEAQYSAFCHEDGGVVDDLLVYRMDEGNLRLVVNAANIAKDWNHISSFASRFDVSLDDESDAIALLALQGPHAASMLSGLTNQDLDAIAYYAFAEGEVASSTCLISRTGYTGEDGFELYLSAEDAPLVWRALEEVGATPAGLGARDSLRLEMGYALYGNDIDDETTALEAGLGWLVEFDAGEFVGSRALAAQKSAGVDRRLRAIRLLEKGFPRPGYDLQWGGEIVGRVRSGTVSPSLGYGIATGYLPSKAGLGDSVEVVIRGRSIPGKIVRPPFYTEGSLKR